MVVMNQKLTVSRDRNGSKLPEEINISDADWAELVKAFGKINLEEIPKLKIRRKNDFMTAQPSPT